VKNIASKDFSDIYVNADKLSTLRETEIDVQRINLVFLEKNVSESHDNRNDGRPTLLQWLRATLVLNIGGK